MKISPGGREESGKDILRFGFTFYYPALISLLSN